GNVWEWCNDRWVCDLGTAPVTDPTGPDSGSYRVFRGGCWGISDDALRCASRYDYGPPDSCHGIFGFRAARTVSAP
ncbi:MAG: SUMF1/EgtB/PvdO family nonheme iron enzyme, partial [Candidatus Eisenbacteria sp.]|nr:SUMF1/EgtB/PvdO family nonheme iron enzyme [Candidatus Eisenbacteria bacterium]